MKENEIKGMIKKQNLQLLSHQSYNLFSNQRFDFHVANHSPEIQVHNSQLERLVHLGLYHRSDPSRKNRSDRLFLLLAVQIIDQVNFVLARKKPVSLQILCYLRLVNDHPAVTNAI
jgi:hypothetical protein